MPQQFSLMTDYSVMQEGSFPACCSGRPGRIVRMSVFPWNLFLLLETAVTQEGTCDEEMKAYRERVSLFLEASQAYKNSLRVLENIPGSHMFIDWSQSNDIRPAGPHLYGGERSLCIYPAAPGRKISWGRLYRGSRMRPRAVFHGFMIK